MAGQNRRFLRLSMFVAALAIVGASTPARAQAEEANPVAAISQSQPGFYVRASCDRDSHVYYEGDSLSIKLKCEADAYIYAVYQQADGKTYQIFPNSGQPNNHVKAGEEVMIPAQDDAFRWTVTAPFGKEQILVVAAKEPLKILAQDGAQQSKFVAISSEVLKGAGLELEQQAAKSWTEHRIEITTAPRPAAPAPVTSERRFGLFIGVGQFEFPGGASPLSYAVSDATLMGHTFKDVGGIPNENVILLGDKLARKAIIKAIITEALPAKTRPGDTIFIYYSGHGGPIPDEPVGQPGHDEIDGKDELITTYDMMDIDSLLQFLLDDQNGKLTKEAHARAEQLRGFVKDDRVQALAANYFRLRDEYIKLKEMPKNDPRRMTALEKLYNAREIIDAEIARETAISDDEFGHWLQSLDGRQVIVILDACHSGGFSKNAIKQPIQKDLTAKPAKFMSSTAGRLKDIGQRDVALLAAAPSHLSSLEGPLTWGGVMTHFLDETIKHAAGPLTLQQAFDRVKADMAAYFERRKGSMGENKPHEPQLYNDCREMPLLRL